MQTFFLQPISGPQGPPHGPVLGPNGSRRLRRLLQTTRSVSESKDERLQSTLMALDSFLQSAPPPQSSGVRAYTAESTDAVLSIMTSSTLKSASADVTPSEDIRQPPKASEAAERSHNVPSTSQADPSPALDWRDWRYVCRQSKGSVTPVDPCLSAESWWPNGSHLCPCQKHCIVLEHQHWLQEYGQEDLGRLCLDQGYLLGQGSGQANQHHWRGWLSAKGRACETAWLNHGITICCPNFNVNCLKHPPQAVCLHKIPDSHSWIYQPDDACHTVV